MLTLLYPTQDLISPAYRVITCCLYYYLTLQEYEEKIGDEALAWVECAIVHMQLCIMHC